MQRGFTPIFIIVGILIIALVGTGVFLLGKKSVIQTIPAPSHSPSATDCTLEAKLCPDGTSVFRIGSKCEFAQCPVVNPYKIINTENSDWNLYQNSQFKYQMEYPKAWYVQDFLMIHGSPFQIITKDKNYGVPFGLIVQGGSKDSFDEMYKNSKFKKISVDGYKAIRNTITEQQPQSGAWFADEVYILGPSDQVFHLINSVGDKQNRDQQTPIFNHMLETFQFTE